MRIGVYPGTFDPFTMGHLDILTRASALFDKVIVAVLSNSGKKPYFSVEERKGFIEQAAALASLTNCEVDSFGGLLVDFARQRGANVVIRGLRAISDFEYELQIASMNKELAPEIETVFLMTNPRYSYLSSSIVKEIARYGSSITEFVPAAYADIIAERLLER